MNSTLTIIDATSFQSIAAGALVMIGLISSFAFILRRRLGLRGVMALHMLNMLTILLTLFILLQPKGIIYGGISMLLLIGMIRAMSKFENTDKS